MALVHGVMHRPNLVAGYSPSPRRGVIPRTHSQVAYATPIYTAGGRNQTCQDIALAPICSDYICYACQLQQIELSRSLDEEVYLVCDEPECYYYYSTTVDYDPLGYNRFDYHPQTNVRGFIPYTLGGARNNGLPTTTYPLAVPRRSDLLDPRVIAGGGLMDNSALTRFAGIGGLGNSARLPGNDGLGGLAGLGALGQLGGLGALGCMGGLSLGNIGHDYMGGLGGLGGIGNVLGGYNNLGGGRRGHRR